MFSEDWQKSYTFIKYIEPQKRISNEIFACKITTL